MDERRKGRTFDRYTPRCTQGTRSARHHESGQDLLRSIQDFSLTARPVTRVVCCVAWLLTCAVSSGCKPSADEGEVEATVARNADSPFSDVPDERRRRGVETSPWREIRQIAIGERFVCGLLRDFQVYCWGAERYGELGLGPPLQSEHPWPAGPLRSLGEVRELRANRGYSCALSGDQQVSCWGNNYYGQLGDGTNRNRTTPAPVEGLPEIHQLELGGTHACGLTLAGTVWCWGDNEHGQLGDEVGARQATPHLIRGLGTVADIALGNRSSCFLRRSGVVACIGSNEFGELGRGVDGEELPDSAVPVNVAGVPPLESISGYANHYCGKTSEGAVYCWGGEQPPTARQRRNHQRRLDANLPVDPLPKPGSVERVDGLGGVESLAVGLDFTCALRADGKVYCWGTNEFGQLGSGSQSDRDDPTPVANVHEAVDLWAGARNVCVRVADGRILCWGDNRGGQLGNGGYVTGLVPGAVMRPPRVTRR